MHIFFPYFIKNYEIVMSDFLVSSPGLSLSDNENAFPSDGTAVG